MQLDNTTKENKNSTVFSYLSMLEERGIFKKIKVNFLLVGHTHDHIDKMFSRFSKKLTRCDAFTLPTLSRLIMETYTPKPDVQHLDEVYNFKRFSVDGVRFNHVFFIKRNALSHNQMLLYAKQYSSSSQSEPQEGCRLLFCFPDVVIHGA